MANQLSSFDPVGSFQGARSKARTIQAQEQDLALQPARNELSQLKLSGERQRQSQQTATFDQGKQAQALKFIIQSNQAALGLPQEQRSQAFQSMLPLAQEAGIPVTPEDIQGNPVDNASLNSAIQNATVTLQSITQGGGPEAFTLSPGQKRFEGGKEIASVAPAAKGASAGLPAETVAFNDLIKDFSPEQQETAKLVKAGLKGRAVSNAVLSAIESGDITNLAEAKAEIKQAEKFGELTGSSRAKAIDKGFDSIIKIDRGIKNIDDAIATLDNGAGVGAVEKIWPSIKAASVELDNVRGRMALDVVGATTFGALSKGELDLAKDVALPTGLNTDELKDYLIRKKDAQTKLRAWYNEQVQFLDQGGTVAGFLREKERQAKGGDDAASDTGQPKFLGFE